MLLKFLQNSKRNIFPRASFFAGWKLGTFRYSPWRCFVKQNALKNFANFTGNNLCWSLVLMKWQFWETATLLKKTPIQVASCKISCLFLNFFLKKDPNIGDPNIFVNFVKFLRKIFFRTSPSSDFSYDVVFSFLQTSEVCSLKSICLVIHKPIQSGVVMEIR